MTLIELGGKMFSLAAIESIVPGTCVDTTYITLRGGSSNVLDVPYEKVRDRLARQGFLLTKPMFTD